MLILMRDQQAIYITIYFAFLSPSPPSPSSLPPSPPSPPPHRSTLCRISIDDFASNWLDWLLQWNYTIQNSDFNQKKYIIKLLAHELRQLWHWELWMLRNKHEINCSIIILCNILDCPLLVWQRYEYCICFELSNMADSKQQWMSYNGPFDPDVHSSPIYQYHRCDQLKLNLCVKCIDVRFHIRGNIQRILFATPSLVTAICWAKSFAVKLRMRANM